jgi:hypothetical protein
MGKAYQAGLDRSLQPDQVQPDTVLHALASADFSRLKNTENKKADIQTAAITCRFPLSCITLKFTNSIFRRKTQIHLF